MKDQETAATKTSGELIGYARVSSKGQDLTIQTEALKVAGCSIIRSEKMTGTTREGRSELETLIAYLRSGDTVVVTRIDRLARSLRDLSNIVHEITEKGAFLRATEQSVDTSTPAGRAFLGMLGIFAEFETNIRKERQREGIDKARENGVYAARTRAKPALAKGAAVKRLIDEGMSKEAVASLMGISRSSVYRVLRENCSTQTMQAGT